MSALAPVRFSRLKLMGKSPAHYAHGFGGESGAMRKGTALHRYMLGARDSVLVYPGRRAGKEWERFKAEAPSGSEILIDSEFRHVDGMRRAIEAHPRALALLDGSREHTIDWTWCGRACSGTPDVVQYTPAGKVLVELKTCNTSAPDLFKFQAKRMGYHAQLAWYANGLELSNGVKPGQVVAQYIVVVESSPPYPVTVVQVTDAMRSKGERQCRAWLETLLVCEATGRFPGYVDADVEWDDDDGAELDWGDEEAAE